MKRTYIPIFVDWLESTKKLTAAEKGRLVDALCSYARGDASWEKLVKGNERFLVDELKLKIDRYYDRLDEISARRSEAGKKGAGKRWQSMANDANASDSMANIASISKSLSKSKSLSLSKERERESPTAEEYGEVKRLLEEL